MNGNNLEKFEDRLDIHFDDKSLLQRAFTHRSYINEHPDKSIKHNERLEFLGDAVLELVVTDHLFSAYPDRPEGELTAIRAALVNTLSISAAAKKIGAEEFLWLSKGEAKDTGRGRRFILANTYEAIIGAIYLDQGYETAAHFISETLLSEVGDIIDNESWRDAKSVFQEEAQKHKSITPTYEIIDEYGPDHDKVFTVGVFLEENQIATGKGKSKQEAESMAAEAALSEKGWE
ncbi:MAG: ribonuclease III [Candidatus Paceibacterota bacterium]